MDCTDYLCLSELKLFKNLREHLPKHANKPTNLLTVKDNVLYAWDSTDNCVLTLNIKAAKSRVGDNITYQSLLPILPVMFKPEHILVNDNGTLLVIFGPSGVLVMELPSRCPPYGAFDHNKEVIYCRSHTLDERLFLSNDTIEVRQVRFHPGSVKNNHIVALTSDNQLRVYVIENSDVRNLTIFPIGEKPKNLFPGTKTTYLAAYGEVGIDFDFGQPEFEQNPTNLMKKSSTTQQNDDNKSSLQWPIYLLRGDCNVYLINLSLNARLKSTIKGPIWANFDNQQNDCCSIICLNTNPEIVCIANSNGTIYHSIILPKNEQELRINDCDRDLLCFESIELELGLSTSDNNDNNPNTSSILLYKDESNRCRYFATHSTGIHSITVACLKDLQNYVTTPDNRLEHQQLDDIFMQESKIEYLLCTQTTTTTTKTTADNNNNNPIYGFCLYYEPISLITMLNNGNLVSLALLTTIILPKIEDLFIDDKIENKSPIKKNVKEPFDQRIEKILKTPSNQPILKLSSNGEHSQKECYELLQRASQVFRDYYFENLTKTDDELHKYCRQLKMMTEFQLNELARMNNEKQHLQQKAEYLSEKYEDIKDKQDQIMKRCEKLLILITQKKYEPSDAELEYLDELKTIQTHIEQNYKPAIDKLKLKIKYQQIQIDNWKNQDERTKNLSKALAEQHENTIRNNLKEMSEKISSMIRDVNDYKERLNLK